MTGPGLGARDDLRSDGSRSLAGDIAALHKYAVDVATAAETLPSEVGGLRDRVAADACRVAAFAREPITVGVVGQFSSGKSLLLGLLLGRPDLLPVEDRATTANVTALHLTIAPAGSRPERTDAQVQYLTEAELIDCVAYMLEVLQKRATDVGLDPGPLRELAALSPLSRLWPALEQWCRTTAWPHGELQLKLLVGELVALKAAATAAPALLGWSTPVRPTTVDRALELPMADAEADLGVFPEPPAPPAAVDQRAGEPDVAQLRATLPLVKRVTLDIAVPADVWDLSGLRGDNEMVLLDFPGLGAKRSLVRDYYLSRRELAEVTTILVLINGQAGGSDVPTEFPSMMGRDPEQLRDRVLAVVGRFDQLPDYVAPDLSAGERAGPPITDRTLTDGPLRTVMSDARDLVGLGHDDRIAFHSAMVGIGHLDEQRSGRPHYDEEFRRLRQLDRHVSLAQAEAVKWGKVAARLAADDLSSILQVPLRELARDGGVAHIRTMIERHVRAHGLRIRHAELVRRADQLRRDVERLLDAGEDEVGASTVAARAAKRLPVETLMADVGVALRELQERAATDLPDPARFLVGPEQTLATAVAEHAVDEVFSWPEWDRLFDAVDDRIVRIPKGAKYTRGIPELRRGTRMDLPRSTAEFLERFEQAVEACAERSSELAWTAFDAWVRHQNDSLAALREAHRRVVDEDARRTLEDVLGRDDEWSPLLKLAVDVTWLSGEVRNAVPQFVEQHSELSRPAVFPLPPESWFAWHPEIPDDVRRAMDAILSRHQVQLARLRRELVKGVAAAVLARLGVVQLGMADATADILADLRVPLDDHEPFVDAVVGDDGGPGDDPYAVLRALTRPALRRA